MTAFAIDAIAASTARNIPIFHFIRCNFYIDKARRMPFIRDSGIDLLAIKSGTEPI
jgi:hypothetical protein